MKGNENAGIGFQLMIYQKKLIAQVPIEKRDESRLMVLNREKQTIEHKTFKEIIDYLEPGDCLVRNNTKVIPARIYGRKATGAHVDFCY